jgi:hypothetical protein
LMTWQTGKAYSQGTDFSSQDVKGSHASFGIMGRGATMGEAEMDACPMTGLCLELLQKPITSKQIRAGFLSPVPMEHTEWTVSPAIVSGVGYSVIPPELEDERRYGPSTRRSMPVVGDALG